MKTEMEAARDAATPRIAEWMEARLCSKISCHQIAEESIRRAFDAGVDYARGSQWVAVSKLPETQDVYLVRNQQGSCDLGWFNGTRFNDCDGNHLYDAHSWMPIPPYTADSGQEGHG